MSSQGPRSSGQQENRESEFGLADVLAVLKRRGKLVALLVVVATIVTAAVVYVLPNRYEASATVLVDPRKRTIVNVEQVVADLRVDTPTIESEVEVLRSASVAMRVIDALRLREDPEFNAPGPVKSALMRAGLARGPSSEPPNVLAAAESPAFEGIDRLLAVEPERDELLAGFLDRLKVQRVRNTFLIEIRFSSVSPVKAAKVANAIAEAYVKEQLEAKTKAAESAMKVLEERLGTLTLKLREAEQRVEMYKAENNIFDAEGQLLSEKQLARAMEQTVQARTVTAEARAKYEQILRMRERGESRSTIADVLQSHTVRLLKDNLSKISRREAELVTRYGPKHPEMAKVRAELSDAQTALNTEVDQIIANLKTEYEVALERERTIGRALAQHKDQQIVSKDAGVRLRELEREASTSRAVHEAFLARYKQTAETLGLQQPDARVVEAAAVPLKPVGPKRKQMVLMAFAASLMLGFGLAFVYEMAQPGIKRTDEVERALEVVHLASLPDLARGGPGSVTALKALRQMATAPTSVFAEAIRTARHEIDARRWSAGPRLILVAGSVEGEGSSVVAANLAHAYATGGVRTVLIDANLRKPVLSHELLPDRRGGLGEHLGGLLKLDDVLLRDPAIGLCFLPAHAGIMPGPSPAEALASDRMQRLLGQLRERFDVIIVDVPPILPVVDARVMADQADQIVLVMGWRSTPRQLVRRAVHAFGPNMHKIAGVVLNRVDADGLAELDGVKAAAEPRLPDPMRRAA